MLERLKKTLLHPAVIEAAIDRAVACLSEPDVDVRGLRQELARIEQKIERLTNAIAAGAGEVPEIVRALRVADQQRANLLSRLRVVERSAAELNPKDIAADIRARLTEWHGLLHDEAAKAHRMLRQLIVGRLELRAEADGSGFVFTGVGTLVPLLSGTIPALAALLHAPVDVPQNGSSPTGQPRFPISALTLPEIRRKLKLAA